MKIQSIFLSAVLALSLASCETIRKSTVTTADVQTAIVQYPTVTDLVVLPKTERTIVWSFVPFKTDNLALQKANLMFDLLKEAEADVLLEPQYNFTKQPYGERRLTITGYPARFKDFRKATPADIEALKAAYVVGGTADAPTIYNVAQRTNKRKGFLGLW